MFTRCMADAQASQNFASGVNRFFLVSQSNTL